MRAAHARAARRPRRRAREIEPTYCEPGYWIGVTRLNQARRGRTPPRCPTCRGRLAPASARVAPGRPKPRADERHPAPPAPQGASREGVAALRAALACKYVAAEALTALNRVYAALARAAPQAPAPLLVGAARGRARSNLINSVSGKN